MAHKDVLGMASWVFMMVLPSINYVIFPLAQTLASPDLRQSTIIMRLLQGGPSAHGLGYVDINSVVYPETDLMST